MVSVEVRSNLTGEVWPADGAEEEQRAWFNANRARIGLKPIPTREEMEEEERRHPSPKGEVKGHRQEWGGYHVGDMVKQKESDYIDGFYKPTLRIIDIYDEGPDGHVFLILADHGANRWASPKGWRRIS